MSEIPLLLLILLALAVLLRVDLIFYLVYVLAGSYLLARWWTARSLPHLHVTRRFQDRVFLGEAVPVVIEIVNRSWWPVPWLRCGEKPPPALSTGQEIRHVIALGPRGRAALQYTLMGRQRGYYEIGPAALVAGDLFGFAEVQARVEGRDHLIVYPRVIPLSRVRLTSRLPHGTIRSRQPIFADPARVIGVRAYSPGDPWRNVHWKASARVGSLQVKKHEPAISLATVIFLDLHVPAYTRQSRYQTSEWAIVVAASLATYLADQRQAVGLACTGVDQPTGTSRWIIPSRPGRVHLMKLLEWLARVQLAETVPLAQWLTTAALDLAWGTTVIAITPTGDEATCRSLGRLLRAGLNPMLLAVEPHAQFQIVRERARLLGFEAYQVADEDELARWCAARKLP